MCKKAAFRKRGEMHLHIYIVKYKIAATYIKTFFELIMKIHAPYLIPLHLHEELSGLKIFF